MSLTVAELIEALQQFPADSPVDINDNAIEAAADLASGDWVTIVDDEGLTPEYTRWAGEQEH